MSEVCERNEVIQLTDGETEQFEAQLKRGPNQAAKRTIARVRKARTAAQADNREKAVA